MARRSQREDGSPREMILMEIERRHAVILTTAIPAARDETINIDRLGAQKRVVAARRDAWRGICETRHVTKKRTSELWRWKLCRAENSVFFPQLEAN